MTKRMKPPKPLRDSLASHRLEPEEEVATYARRVQSLVEGREILFFSLLVAIVLILGGGGVYWFVKSNTESLAAERLSVAYAAYRKVLFPGATTTPRGNGTCRSGGPRGEGRRDRARRG